MISPYRASLMIFTKPAVSPRPCALPFAWKGNLATLTSKPFSLACASVEPKLAICGCE
ncbi:hypothetical protein SALBM135S_10118 [Streptomyces alboniger]